MTRPVVLGSLPLAMREDSRDTTAAAPRSGSRGILHWCFYALYAFLLLVVIVGIPETVAESSVAVVLRAAAAPLTAPFRWLLPLHMDETVERTLPAIMALVALVFLHALLPGALDRLLERRRARGG